MRLWRVTYHVWRGERHRELAERAYRAIKPEKAHSHLEKSAHHLSRAKKLT